VAGGTLLESCAAGVVFEQENIALCDRLLPNLAPADIDVRVASLSALGRDTLTSPPDGA
jgi:hypothetical protein